MSANSGLVPWFGSMTSARPSTTKGCQKSCFCSCQKKPSRPRTRLSCGDRDAELVALLRVRVVVIVSVDRRDGIAVVVEEQTGEIPGRVINAVVEVRIVRVVERRIDLAVEVVAGVRQVEVADVAFDREPRLPPLVVGVLLREVRDSVVAGDDEVVEVVAPGSVAVLVLNHEGRRDRPVVVQIHAQCRARAVRLDRVVVVLGELVVVDRNVVVGTIWNAEIGVRNDIPVLILDGRTCVIVGPGTCAWPARCRPSRRPRGTSPRAGSRPDPRSAR